eukprot:652593-Amorphochlora_amoeboformis.AAC.2
MEEKVEARMVEVRHEAHEHAKRRAEKKKMKVLKNRDEILREQRKKHMLLLVSVFSVIDLCMIFGCRSVYEDN